MKSLLLLLATIGTAPAAVLSFTDPSTFVIPDGDSSGLLRVQNVSASGENILGVELDIRVSGTSLHQPFLGDLYAYLSNGTSLAVLMNRPGRRTGTPAGYNDAQSLNVTFSTTGADFHEYRLTATGSQTVALSAPLTGTWQADGRAVDPSVVLDSSPRTAGLDAFAGQPATGTWRLFISDMSLGGGHQIESWTLRLITVPEPGSAALLGGALLALARRRKV